MTTDQTAADRKAQADAQARENIADFRALAEGIVGVFEAVTGKQGTMALDQAVRQRFLTPDAAVRIWRRSGRQDATVQPLPGIAEYRQQFGYRRPGELDNSGPRPVGRSVSFDQNDDRKRAVGLAEERRYHREIAERSQLSPSAQAFRERNRLDGSGPPGTVDFHGQEEVLLP